MVRRACLRKREEGGWRMGGWEEEEGVTGDEKEGRSAKSVVCSR